MAHLSVQHCLLNFNDAIKNASDLLDEMSLCKNQTSTGRLLSIGSRRKEIFASLALLRMHLAWEDFIENVFLRYMCGGTTISGYSPKLLVPPSTTMTNAFSLLCQGNSFLNWSTDKIEQRAKQYFDQGDPFCSMLGSARNSLDEISTIRNRFAHRSEFARLKFDTVVRNAFGYLPRGMSPGRFLLKADPSNPSLRFIDRYVSILRTSATIIVP